ncbi:outer membrane protein assembly factor BamE [Marinomonas sp. M1K-6]|uniref:Outer membrane protein assembly factor BamE n=1 Tax=Marinomonas profundi TaxID=2726122 RepID=A0A847R4J4_9GAMM|nr:outer membrane protein assembly factor BamE [Marinomonas profundi]NLQ17403.1 outer membrane protein assembly factor BamE [Marinomonas profundi]UDV01929.1 outer membrane protein assembly factor BamE [Marinomonas profundi]
MKKSAFILCAALSISACSLFPPPYKVPVTQGNLITQEQLSQLKVGMSESQVTYLLGNPMLIDTFKPNEWHYLYASLYAEPGTKHSDADDLVLIFSDGVLTQIKNN